MNSISDFLYKKLNEIKDFWNLIWNTISSFLTPIITGIKNKIGDIYNGIVLTFTNVKNWISSSLGNIFAPISIAFESFKTSFLNGWNGFWNGLGNVVSNVGNIIKNTFSEIMNGIIGKINDGINSINNIVNKGASVLKLNNVPNIPTIPTIKSTTSAVSNNSLGVSSAYTSNPFSKLPNYSSGLIFKEGGVVPGGENTPVPILAHGGETVVPFGGMEVLLESIDRISRNQDSQPIVININNASVRKDSDIIEIAKQVKEIFSRSQVLRHYT